MDYLKVVELDEKGDSTVPVSLVCYHPLQVPKLLKGENVEPKCCANELEMEVVAKEEVISKAMDIIYTLYGNDEVSETFEKELRSQLGGTND